MGFGARHVSTSQRYYVRNTRPEIKPASNYPAWDREESEGGINPMGPSQPNRVPARQKDVAGHLDNTRLMRAFPESPNPDDGNAIFNDGSVKRPDPGSKHQYAVASLGEGPRNLLANGGRSAADRRIFVVDKQKSHAKTQRKGSDRISILFRGNYGLRLRQ